MIDRHYFHDRHKLANGVAQFAATCLLEALAKNDQASLVLPGGQTPRVYLAQLSQQNLPWQKIHLTLSDERWVNATDSNSNEKQLREIFLQRMRIAPHFIPLKTAHQHPDAAIDTVDAHLASMPLPFDLAILGMGEDGHIASLFPGMALDLDNTHLCQAATPPTAPTLRISLSFRALAKSRQILFIILGKSKRRLLDHLTTSTDTDIPFVKLLQYQSVEIFESDV
ncbi:MAG: 6-phosphogluconolactonase [Nitrosomonas sp.]|nr:6-phosphogluconolactonase [Nitrosomonas sp.]